MKLADRHWRFNCSKEKAVKWVRLIRAHAGLPTLALSGIACSSATSVLAVPANQSTPMELVAPLPNTQIAPSALSGSSPSTPLQATMHDSAFDASASPILMPETVEEYKLPTTVDTRQVLLESIRNPSVKLRHVVCYIIIDI